MRKIKDKLKAIYRILVSKEYFVVTANQKKIHKEIKNELIAYDYISNTDRKLFYVFVKSYLEDNV